MKKRYFALLLLICLSLAVLGGCFPAKDKEFSKAGMTITLTTKFTEKELASQTAYYESFTSIVTALKEEFSLMEGFQDYTLEEYTNIVLQQNKLNTTVTRPQGKEYYSFSFEKRLTEKTFIIFRQHLKVRTHFGWYNLLAPKRIKKNFSPALINGRIR